MHLILGQAVFSPLKFKGVWVLLITPTNPLIEGKRTDLIFINGVCPMLPAIVSLSIAANERTMTEITEQELADARKIWGDALIAIAKAFEEEGIDAGERFANGALDTGYGFHLGPVLFKPTLASGEQTFRTTREGALAYFVGHTDEYPGDGGFGIKGWRSVVAETAASFVLMSPCGWAG